MKNKIISLLQNERFLSQLNDALTPEDIQKVFKNEGINISVDKAEVVSEALESVNERIRNAEEISQEELDEIGGGRSFFRNTLELIIMGAVLAEGVNIAKKVRERGGLNDDISNKLSGIYQKGKGAFDVVGDKVADWLTKK